MGKQISVSEAQDQITSICTIIKRQQITGECNRFEMASATPTGIGAGDLIEDGSIKFLGHTFPRHLLVYEEKVKMALYQSSYEINVGKMVFSLALIHSGGGQYENLKIPADMLEEANQIIESFQLE